MANEKKEMQKKAMTNPVGTERTRSRKVYVPKVDIYETKDATVLVADMPGVDETSVDITLEKNILTITGSVEPDSYKDHTMAYAEYDVGDYQRAFTISDEVNREKIKASVKQGVLRLTLPKAEPVKAKKITIKGE
jgi:HSP20 family molecular chaperone IbpA